MISIAQGLGGFYQRLHERRIVTHPIRSHLYRYGFRIAGGSRNELLYTLLEAIVRVMNENVACTYRGEEVITANSLQLWP